MKTKLLIAVILLFSANVACAQVLQNGLRFTGKNQCLIISKEDIDYAEKSIDDDLNVVVTLYLKASGLNKLSEFTERLTGEVLTIRYKNMILYDKIPVHSRVTMNNIFIPVGDEKLADDMVDYFNEKRIDDSNLSEQGGLIMHKLLK